MRKKIVMGGAAVAIVATFTATAVSDAQTKRASVPTFTGKYKLQPQQDDTTAEIVALGNQRYKVSVTWGGMTAGGNYNSDGWEGTGEARGNILTIREQKGDGGSQTCTLTFVAGARPLYRMSGCGGGDGSYRRVPAKR